MWGLILSLLSWLKPSSWFSGKAGAGVRAFLTEPMTNTGKNVWMIILFSIVILLFTAMNVKYNAEIHDLAQSNQLMNQRLLVYSESLDLQAKRNHELNQLLVKRTEELVQTQEKLEQYFIAQAKADAAVTKVQQLVKLLSNPELHGCVHKPIPQQLIREIRNIDIDFKNAAQ